MKKHTLPLFFILALLAAGSAGCKRKPVAGEMTDARDGRRYQTVTLCDRTWLAEDLNYETTDSWCYDDDPANCDIYGRLYTWDAAVTACPAGWHLASDQEWQALARCLDPLGIGSDDFEISTIAGGMLKTTGIIEDETGLWSSPNKGATNASGFSALPSGNRNPSGTFRMLGYHIMFWTATGYDEDHAWTMMLDNSQSGIFRDYMGATKGYGLSVRCVRD